MAIKIRQEISIINLDISGISASNSNEIVQLDTTQYVNPTYYFEVVTSASNTGGGTFTLRRNGTTTDDVSITNTSVANVRLRSTSFTPPAGQTEYIARNNRTSGNTGLKSARIIIIDNPTTLTSTETQIEIGNNETGKTNTTASALNNPKYWLYTAANWDGTKTFYAECTYAMSTTKVSGTITLQEDNGSFASWADKVTIVSAGTASTPTRVRSASFDPTDGRHYRIATKNSSSKSTLSIYNAKIIVDQSDGFNTYGVGGAVGLLGGTASSGETTQALAQSFKILTTSSISAVKLKVSKNNSPVDNFQVDIVSSRGGSSLASATLGGGSITTSLVEYTFTFGLPVSLTGGSTYYIQLTRSGARDATNNYNVAQSTSSNYSDGGVSTRDNNVWSSESSTNDIGFLLVGQAGFTLLEPQSLLLNTGATGTGLLNYQTLIDKTNEWSGVTIVGKHQIEVASTSAAAKLVDIDNSNTDVTSSSVTGNANLDLSADIWGNITDGHQIDVNVTNNTSTVSASRLITAVSVDRKSVV